MHTNPARYNCQSVLLFVILLIGLAMYLCLSGFILLSSAYDLVTPQSGAGSNIGTNFIIASGLGFCAVSMLPAVIFSFQRMRGKSIRPFQTRPVKIWQAITLGAGWIGAVLLSDYLYQKFSLGWLAAAPFYIISIGLPLVLLVWIGVGGIPLGSRNRFWGSLGIGMTVGPFLATLMEFFVYLGVLVILIFILMLNPNWLATLQQVIAQIHTATDIDSVMQILAPYLSNSLVLISLFLVLGLLTPLVEETLKPVIVWLLAKRLQGPSQGFALGVISGAGFALVESLLASSTPGQGWGQLLAVRAGGGLMHIFASGVMGWGIASAWQGKPLRLLGTYVLSVIIHGLWNSAAIIIEIGSLQPYLNNDVFSKSLDSFSLAGTIVLGLLVLLTLPALILINRKMRSIMVILGSNAQSDIIPPPIQ
ncbi:MAG: PrsW family glutamic-type intramembrane protease [Anaerolineales bacterium]|jgi:RsiW-degrading membrane proteinase PrsW (M82 family)